MGTARRRAPCAASPTSTNTPVSTPSCAAEAVVAGLVLRARPTPGPAALVTLGDFVRLVVATALGGLVTAVGTGLAFSSMLDTAFLETARTTSTAHAVWSA